MNITSRNLFASCLCLSFHDIHNALRCGSVALHAIQWWFGLHNISVVSRCTFVCFTCHVSCWLLIGAQHKKREKRQGSRLFGYKILNGHSLIIPAALTPFVYLSSVERLMYHGQKYFINVSLLPWKKQHTVFEDHLLELWMPANETLVNLTKPWNECLCLTEPQVRLASVAWLSSVNILCFILIGAIFVWPWKMVSVSVCYLFY